MTKTRHSVATASMGAGLSLPVAKSVTLPKGARPWVWSPAKESVTALPP